MSPQLIALGGLLLIAVSGITGGMLLVSVRRQRLAHRRMQLAFGLLVPDNERVRAPATPWPIRLVAAIGGGIARSGLLPAATLAELEQSLRLAGLRSGNGLGLFIGAKLLLVILCPVTAILLTREFDVGPAIARMAPFFAAAAGLLLPDKVVSGRRDKYLAKLQQSVPDALDMMVICTQAGLGMTPTMQRVAHEIAHGHPAIAGELAQTVSELQIAVNATVPLTALGTRTGLDSLKRVATTLIQSTQYGTPLSEALRGLAAEMRQEALTRYEEKAARLPVMLTIPMIILVLPCVFIVVGGPAMLQIGKALHH